MQRRFRIKVAMTFPAGASRQLDDVEVEETTENLERSDVAQADASLLYK